MYPAAKELQKYTLDEIFMNRCIELARLGAGSVAPNPMVGSVIVYNNRIIGEGYHRKYGGPHAEVEAINSVENPQLLPESTLYVNLEPCSHFGKTPPCANLIVEKKIAKVIIGTSDPNPAVSGNGISYLKANKTEVVSGVLEKECNNLNRRFFSLHLNNRPYIILKWAETSDGFIDIERDASAPVQPNWITSESARILVHKWRSEEQAILVGTKTVLKDNPSLNIRFWSGTNPVRVIIDRTLKIGEHHNVMNNTQQTIVYNEIIEKVNQLTKYYKINFSDDVETEILKSLAREKIISLIIEGGAYTLNRFIEKGVWDEARVFVGDITFKKGVKAPEIKGTLNEKRRIGNSLLKIVLNDNPAKLES